MSVDENSQVTTVKRFPQQAVAGLWKRGEEPVSP